MIGDGILMDNLVSPSLKRINTLSGIEITDVYCGNIPLSLN